MSNFDVRTFNLNLIPALVALLRHRAVGAAARELGVSQSAMSHSLAKLRASLDDPLLIPQGRAFVLSARAQQIARSLPQALDGLGAVLGGGPSFDPRSASLTVRIATVDYFEFTALSSVMKYLRAHAPGVRLSVERLTADSAAALQGGGLDFILGGAGLVHGAGLERAVLYDDPFRVIARRDHPRIRGRVSLRAYLDAEHVVVRFEGRRGGVIDRTLARMNLERRVGLWVPHFVSAPLAVVESDMISTVASAVAERAKTVLGVRVFAPPVEFPAAPITVWWPRAQVHDPARSWFRELLLRGELLPPVLRRLVRARRATKA